MHFNGSVCGSVSSHQHVSFQGPSNTKVQPLKSVVVVVVKQIANQCIYPAPINVSIRQSKLNVEDEKTRVKML